MSYEMEEDDQYYQHDYEEGYEADYQQDYGGGYEEDYKAWQDRYEGLEQEWDSTWDNERQRAHLENMNVANEGELYGREAARKDWGDEADEGHDDRIEQVRGRKQLLQHSIAHVDGEYEYQTQRMGDVDPDLQEQLRANVAARGGYTFEELEGLGASVQVEDQSDDESEGQQEDDSDMDIEVDSDDGYDS